MVDSNNILFSNFDIPVWDPDTGVRSRHIARYGNSSANDVDNGYTTEGAVHLEILQKLVNIELLQRGDYTHQQFFPAINSLGSYSPKNDGLIYGVQLYVYEKGLLAMTTVGNPGIYKFGKCAFGHSGFFEEWRHIEFEVNFMRPHQLVANSLSWSFPDGVIAALTVYETDRIAQTNLVGHKYANQEGYTHDAIDAQGYNHAFPPTNPLFPEPPF